MEEIKRRALEGYEKVLESKRRSFDNYSSSRRLDIEQFRNFIVQITIISFGAIGFSLPILGNSNFIKNKPIFLLGLMFLAISAIFGLWYVACRIENSIIESYKDWRGNREFAQKLLRLQLFLYKNPGKLGEYKEKMQRISEDEEKFINLELKKGTPGRDKTTYCLIFILSIGIILIFFSML